MSVSEPHKGETWVTMAHYEELLAERDRLEDQLEIARTENERLRETYGHNFSSARKLAELREQFETAQAVIRKIAVTYDGVTPIFRKTGTKLLGADAFTYAPDICEALTAARRWSVTYPAKNLS